MYIRDSSKPPFPASFGLYGKPTTINNTETFASIPFILKMGCLLYTSDAADERSSVDLGGRRIIKKKNQKTDRNTPHKSKEKKYKQAH